MVKKPLVSIVSGTNVLRMVEEALDLIGGITEIVHEDSTVLVKPNLLMPTSEPGAITNPKVVEGIVEIIKEAKPREIMIAESSMVSFDTDKAFEVSGMMEVAKKAGVKWMNLKKKKVVEVPVIEGKLIKSIKLPEIAVKSDVIVNVPVMKTHVQTGVTLSLKNMKGFLPDEEKKRFHRLNLDQCIADLNTVVKPKLTLMDGTTALEGLGPECPPGKPVTMNLIIASRNSVALDAVAAKIMGFDPKEIKHIRNAAKLGLGPLEIEEIKIKGQRIDEVARVFERPPEELVPIQGINMVIGSPCSSCIAECMYAGVMLEKYGLLSKIKDLTMAIGPKAKIPKRTKGKLLICGKCLEKHKDEGAFAPGCPPFIFDSISKIYGFKPLSEYVK